MKIYYGWWERPSSRGLVETEVPAGLKLKLYLDII